MEKQIQDSFGRFVKLLEIPNWNLPQQLQNHCRHFVYFVVCDASETPDEQIRFFAEHLLQEGMVYLCAWGSDCKRVHDLTDSVIVENELKSGNQSTIMTIWHSDESLDDALWFALYAAWPSEVFETTCNGSMIIVVNNDAWSTHIRQRLSNLQHLDADVT